MITTVPANVFSHLGLLNSLELEGNKISVIDKDAFKGLEGKPCDNSHNTQTLFRLDLQRICNIYAWVTTISTPYLVKLCDLFIVCATWICATTILMCWLMMLLLATVIR